MQSSIIPKVIGINDNIDIVENLNLFKISKIKLAIPIENRIEKKYEYPFKCTDDDCCSMNV